MVNPVIAVLSFADEDDEIGPAASSSSPYPA
jgi:hypothetical protein